MSEELNQSEVETEEVITEEVEVEQSDTATDNQEQEPEKEAEPDYQKIIAEKAFEARQAKREKEELARQLEELNAKTPKETRPNVPEIPDQWDDDYDQKIRQREEALLQQARFDERQRFEQEQTQRQQQAQQQEQQQAFIAKVETYSKRAEQLGVSKEELAQAGALIQGDVSKDLEDYILSVEQGPLITKYLAANPLELDKLRTMSPMQAGKYMSTVEDKAAKFGQKKTSNAPEPVESLNGSGAAPSRGPKGAKFE